ncbi:hypothetical protein JTE90_026841 [Oedothorax gibbosus]|uniref:RING-type domain-containing protein n=1 Tax=Oedothorax gibbosus TaxID=931172 RepID=A0AAV6TLG5_9ARAC|nr:hypothetical protein JTE90_026841 [Oedothorax gibbosus]
MGALWFRTNNPPPTNNPVIHPVEIGIPRIIFPPVNNPFRYDFIGVLQRDLDRKGICKNCMKTAQYFISTGKLVAKAPCGHFCVQCLFHLMRANNRCPVCLEEGMTPFEKLRVVEVSLDDIRRI